MREIVVNGRFLSRRITGVERYGREILNHIGSNCRVETMSKNGVAGHIWEQFVLPGRLKPETILWSPANTGPLTVSHQALTIHDLSPLEHAEWFEKSFAVWYRLFLPVLAKKAQVIFTPSEYVRQKVLKQLGAKNVIVTPNGVDKTIFHPGAARKTDTFLSKYILFVGSLQPRKNLAGLMKAWRMIRDEFKDTWLVIAGETGRVFRSVQFADEERIHFVNYVSEVDLPGWYAQAEMLVLPSLDEGFGLPVIEAMACGTPVIVSNGGALPEVAGDAGLVFELSNPDGLAETMCECLKNDELRASLKRKGLVRIENFTWQKTAALVWNTLNEI